MMSPERWQQVEAIYEQALDRPTAERMAYVAEACGDDQALRAELESLLTARSQISQSFLGADALAQQIAETVSTLPPDLSGQPIGKFNLLERLGIGGMGDVYLAQDTQLNRKVALKLLPLQVTGDNSKVLRFTREARAASALNHPNIMTVYEIGEDAGRHFIATEYVEGQTLRARLQQGPMSLAEMVSITSQVAAALSQAHAANIIHRDIKPENLMVRPDGSVKVLDFGIAKLMDNAAPSGSTYNTENGLILGTPGYMSPEQARAQTVTASSDLFSLGVVLYEMLAGELPFKANTQADYLVTLLTTTPASLARMKPDVPLPYSALLERLLAKDPEARPASAAALAEELKKLPLTTVGKASEFVTRFVRPWMLGRKLLVAVSCLLLLLAGSWLVTRWWRNRNQIWGDPARIHHEQIYSSNTGRMLDSLSFSPDGKWVAFCMREEEHSHIYVTTRDGQESRRLTEGDMNERYPIWSPDGQHIAFLSTRGNISGIWRMALAGAGSPQLVLTLSGVHTPIAWRKLPAGEVIYDSDQYNLYAIDVTSKNIVQKTKLSGTQSFFSLAPDGERFLYQARNENGFSLQLHTLSNGKIVTLLSNKNSFYSPSWFSDGQHFAYCTDVTGNIQPHIYSLVNHKSSPIQSGESEYNSVAVAPDGKSVISSSQIQNANIYSIELGNLEKSYTKETGLHLSPALSPDGSSLLVQKTLDARRLDKTLFERVLGVNGKATSLAEDVYSAQISPDGQKLAFTRYQKNGASLFYLLRNSKAEQLLVQKVIESGYYPLPFDLLYRNYVWTPDSRRIIYIAQDTPKTQNVWELNLTDQVKKPLLPNARLKQAFSPITSPDGQSIAFWGKENPSEQKGNAFHFYVFKQGTLVSLFETPFQLNALGWLPDTGEIIVAEGNKKDSRVGWQSVKLHRCQPQLAQCKIIKELPDSYLPSFCLASNGEAIAFVSRSNSASNINLLNLNSGKAQPLTKNMDAGIYYSGLNWAPDSKRLFYSKQTNFEILTLFEYK